MSAVADKLREARALIERGWCQKDYARGKSGRTVSPKGRAARCYCAMGAIGHANHSWPCALLPGVRELVCAVTGFADADEVTILNWNDAPERTQDEVLAAFDRAIELAETES